MKKDAHGCVAFTHPDFVSVDENGQETIHGKKEQQENISRLFAMLTWKDTRETILRFEFTREGAIVDTQSGGTLTLLKNGQKVEWKGSGTYREFWVKVKGVWLEKRSRTLTSTKTRNGQVIP